MGERLLHYTAKPLGELLSFAQAETWSCYAKPQGLWVSVEGEDDWRSWCEAENFGNPAEQLCYDVELTATANVLRISTATGLLRFANKYGMDPYLGRMAGRTMMFGRGIDWQEVAAQHDGIIIAPYQWKLRLDDRVNWYYGWDCASGCVWNAHAIRATVLKRAERGGVET